MVAYAIAQHSHTRADVARRFRRTFRRVFAMVFGDLDAAFAAARRVHTVHAAIAGALPQAIGGYPAGARSHANDADVPRWSTRRWSTPRSPCEGERAMLGLARRTIR
jgi:uncharacterized protein (DUF2236 family)